MKKKFKCSVCKDFGYVNIIYPGSDVLNTVKCEKCNKNERDSKNSEK